MPGNITLLIAKEKKVFIYCFWVLLLHNCTAKCLDMQNALMPWTIVAELMCLWDYRNCILMCIIIEGRKAKYQVKKSCFSATMHAYVYDWSSDALYCKWAPRPFALHQSVSASREQSFQRSQLWNEPRSATCLQCRVATCAWKVLACAVLCSYPCYTMLHPLLHSGYRCLKLLIKTNLQSPPSSIIEI